MAGVRDERQRVFFPGPAPARRSPAVLVMLLIAVLAAIALIWNVSRRSARRAPAPLASVESVDNVDNAAPAPAVTPPGTAAAASEQAAAAASPAPAPAPAIEEPGVAGNQAAIARVINDGRAGLTACYQRALVRDETLVQGQMSVRLSIAPSGRVGAVNISSPAAFHPLEPCLKEAIAKWTFPAAQAPYAAEFALAFRGKQ